MEENIFFHVPLFRSSATTRHNPQTLIDDTYHFFLWNYMIQNGFSNFLHDNLLNNVDDLAITYLISFHLIKLHLFVYIYDVS